MNNVELNQPVESEIDPITLDKRDTLIPHTPYKESEEIDTLEKNLEFKIINSIEGQDGEESFIVKDREDKR